MKKIIFVSPHLDDAFFSCGGLMLSLLKKRHQITVINVFTKAGSNPETLSAKMFLKQTKYSSSETLYKQRVLEDKNVLKSLGVNVINLDEVEALWRKKKTKSALKKFIGSVIPEILHMYPIYRLHISSGKIESEDKTLINRIAKTISTIIKNDKNTLIFSPLGIGNHVDHLVVRKACEKASNNVHYWADIPYLFRNESSLDKVLEDKLYSFSITDKNILRKKERIAKKYQSQYKAVFGQTKCSDMFETIYFKQPQEKWIIS